MVHRTIAVAASAALLLTPAGAASARGSKRVLVVALTGELPGDLAGLPEHLTTALADVIQDSGRVVTRAALDDVLALAGCGEASAECLQNALAILEVGSLVTGEVEPSGSGEIRVSLRLVTDGQPMRSRSFQLGGDQATLESGFRARAGAFWRDPDAAEPPASEPPRPAPAPAREKPDLIVAPPPAEARFSARRVDGLTWAITGGGVGLTLVGGLLLAAASAKQDEVDAAPTDTAEDLEALVDLEATGRSYARWGTGVLVVGALATVAGVALVVKQGTEREPAAARPRAPGPTITLSPMLLERALGAVLTVQAGP
jgi:hypothetical protein